MENFDRICAKIDLNALEKNIENIKKLSPETGLIAIIKADAYGHGAHRIAEFIEDKVDMAAVASVNEALEIRDVFKKPILVIGYASPFTYKEAIANDIILTAFNEETIEEINKTAENIGKTAKIHIAIDTGMRRIGFLPTEENAELIKNIIGKYKNIKIEGMFTHFARADEKDQSTTDIQYERYDAFSKLLKDKGVNIGIRHIANSALIMQPGKYKFDYVRAGIILYGLYPSEEVNKSELELVPVMTLVTHVVNIFTLKKGEGISYGHTFIAEKDLRVATLSCGYADGIKRSLSNKGYVYLNGKKANIIGRVCMDQMMVDISEIPDTKIGDEAEIFGKNIPAQEIGAIAGSFNYEMVSSLTKRVEHLFTYIGDNGTV